MKECELCDVPARMFCESDQASLCWRCDAKVHCANFLVARHLRCLLCHVCQRPTPWKASGSKLGPTLSICDCCIDRRKSRTEDDEEGEGETGGLHESGDEGRGDDEDDVDSDGEEVGKNQGAPWSSTPLPASSSSSSGEESSRRSRASLGVGLKRARENERLCSQGDVDGSSSPAATSCSRPGKDRKRDSAQAGGLRSAVIGSIRRYQRE